MSFTFIIAGVAFFYFFIWFFDSIFKSCMHYPYYAFLNGTGLKFGLLHFSWTTNAFNRLIYKWSKRASKFFQAWFTIGTLTSVFIFLPVSIWILFKTASFNLRNHEESDADSLVLIPVVPGINLPSSDFWSYILALIICSVIHELGHAIAAVQEDVQILSFSVFVTLIIPVAFVKLNSDNLINVPLKKRLNIFCAGIWHNIAVAFIAFLLLKSTPFIFNIAFESGRYVSVKEIAHNSPLKGQKGFGVGDIILDVNECKTKNYDEWTQCLFAVRAERFGFCVSNDIISNHDEIMTLTFKENDIVDCCKENEKQSLCFEYIEPPNGIPSLNQYSCLKPRKIIDEIFIKCLIKGSSHCPGELHCMKPLLGNNTYLHIIQRHNNEPVIYIGHPSDIYNSVKVTQYVPRNKILSFFTPDDFEKAMYYILTISLGLAFLNVIPCFGFDGHHIVRCLVQIYASKWNKSSSFVDIVTVCIVLLGTLCTVPTIIVMFYKTFIT